MPEQLPHGDPPAAGNETGEPALDRVVETKPLLRDELERDDCDEGLRDAACAKAIAGAQRHAALEHGEAARRRTTSRAVVDEHERTRSARRDDRVEMPPERGLRRRAGGGREERQGEERRYREAPHRRHPSAL